MQTYVHTYQVLLFDWRVDIGAFYICIFVSREGLDIVNMLYPLDYSLIHSLQEKENILLPFMLNAWNEIQSFYCPDLEREK